LRYGACKALWVARTLHALFLLVLALFVKLAGLGWMFWVAWLFIVGFIAYEHTIAEPGNPQAQMQRQMPSR
jgi:4-hydroxybenzoate polyprenyltransferase